MISFSRRSGTNSEHGVGVHQDILTGDGVDIPSDAGPGPGGSALSRRCRKTRVPVRRGGDRHAGRPPAELARDTRQGLPAQARRLRQPRRRALHDVVRIDNVHVNRIHLDNGVSFSGFEGCVSYRRSGSAKVGPSYTQREAKKLIRKLPAADVCSAIARRAGSTTTPTIRPTSAGTRCATGCSSISRAGCCTATSTQPGQPPQPHRRHAGRLRQRRPRYRAVLSS